MARNIPMAFFMTDAIAARLYAAERNELKLKLGQVLGQVHSIKDRTGFLPNGTSKDSIVVTGDFEAAREPDEETGEIATSRAGTVYLPDYYAKELREALVVSGGTGLIFAINVFAISTGKRAVPYVYEVESLMDRPASSPMETLKRALAAKGKLSAGLPPPARFESAAPSRLEHEQDARRAQADAAAASLGTREPDDDDYGNADHGDPSGGVTTARKAKAAKPA